MPGRSATALARVSGGRRFANGVDLALSGTLERSDGDTTAALSGVRQRRDQPAWPIASMASGSATSSGVSRRRRLCSHRGLWPPPEVRADGIVRHHLQRTGHARAAPRTGTPPSRPSTTASFGRTSLRSTPGFDRDDYAGVYPFPSDNAAYTVLVNQDVAQGIRWNAGIRVSRPLPGGQTLTAGGIFYDNVRQNQWCSLQRPERWVGGPLSLVAAWVGSTSRTKSACGPGCC